MKSGFANEQAFVDILDNKKVNQLSQRLQELIFSIFKNIEPDSRIDCWKSNYFEKADIKIKINNEIKGISIKTGHFCSMHQETTEKFYCFLTKIGVEKNIIEKIENYMEGYVNGKRVNSKTYIEHNREDIKLVYNVLNEYYIKANLIIRFLIQGTESQNYDCEVILHGTPEYFLWATKNEILKYLMEYPTKEMNYLNFSALNIKCYDRNLRNNPNRIEKQKEIQIKWYSIEDDLKNIMKMRKITEIMQ